MDLSPGRFVSMVLNLFPRGLAFPRGADSVQYKLAQAIADECARLSQTAADLLEERDPRTAQAALDDHERMVGLPDDCSTGVSTTQERRDAVIARLTLQGSLSKKFYTDLAAGLGYTVTVRNYRQFKAGLAQAGDPLSNGNWIYTWQVRAPADTSKRFLAGTSRAGDPLRYVANTLLECTIRKLAPAGTIVLFSYDG